MIGESVSVAPFSVREHPEVRARKLNQLARDIASAGNASGAADNAAAAAAAAALAAQQATAAQTGAQTSATAAATSAGQAATSNSQAQASAVNAAASVDAITITQGIVNQAKLDAQAAFTAADAAKNAALANANASATSAAAALGSATSAAGTATIVEQRATEAALYASSATASANIAALKSDAAKAEAIASSTSSTVATVSATESGVSAAAAYQSELNAGVSSGASGASASAAATSASNAAASQTAAGNSASAANTSKIAAEAANTAATASASAANTSAVNASNSASSATTSSNLSASFAGQAKISEALVAGADFARLSTLTYWGGNIFSAQADFVNANASVVNVAGEGAVYNMTVGPSQMRMRKFLPVKAGRTYRFEDRFRTTVNSPTASQPVAYLGYELYSAAGDLVNRVYSSAIFNLAANGWVNRSIDVTAASLLAVDATAAYVAPIVLYNYNDALNPLNSTQQVAVFRMTDVTDVVAAASSASVATTQATNASASAASASSSAVLSASITGAYLNPNGGFDIWSNPAGPPENHTRIYGTNTTVTRVAGDFAGYDLRVDQTTGGVHEDAISSMPISAGWYVFELEVVTNGGNWAGGGVVARVQRTGGPTYYPVLYIDSDPDINGVVHGPTQPAGAKRIIWRKLIQFASSDTDIMSFGVSAGGWTTGGTTGANSLIIKRYGIRPATPAEVRDQTVLAPLETTVATHTSQISALVTADSATATSIQTLTASIGGAAGDALNKNPTFGDWTGALPANWGTWNQPGTVTKVTGDLGGFAFQQSHGNGGAGGIMCQPAGLNGVKSAGWYVLEADLTLVSGQLAGGGIYCDRGGTSDFIEFGGYADSNGVVNGNGVVGRRYSFKLLFQYTGSGTNWNLYAMTMWEAGFANGLLARTYKWHRASIRDATPQEIRDQTVLTPLQATVSTNSSAIVTAQNGVNAVNLKYGVTLDGNGYVTGFQQNNNGTSGSFTVLADQFRVVLPGLTPRTVFDVSASSISLNSNVTINGALIVTGTITTPAIAANAVTVPVYAYTSSSIVISSYQTIQSVSITTTGGTVKIDFSFLLVGNTAGCNFRLTRNGTDVLPASSLGGGAGGLVAFTMGDIPPAGTHTYALLAQASGTVPQALVRSLFVLECKK